MFYIVSDSNVSLAQNSSPCISVFLLLSPKVSVTLVLLSRRTMWRFYRHFIHPTCFRVPWGYYELVNIQTEYMTFIKNLLVISLFPLSSLVTSPPSSSLLFSLNLLPRCWSPLLVLRVVPAPLCHPWTSRPWRWDSELHTVMKSPPKMWCQQPCTPRCSRSSRNSLVSGQTVYRYSK